MAVNEKTKKKETLQQHIHDFLKTVFSFFPNNIFQIGLKSKTEDN